METGKHPARIVDYGMTKTKAGNPQVFIRFSCQNEESTWYGSPFKKDGAPNDMCLQQLAECGFDPASNSLEILAVGPESNLLITDEDIFVTVKDKTQGDGTMKKVIDFVGSASYPRASSEEIKEVVDPGKAAALKEAGSKFKPRARKKKEDPEVEIPF